VDREGVLKLLAEHKPRLVDRYGVTGLAVFGSVVRGVVEPDSDVDVLVAFDGPGRRRATSA
jgi:predicted nucleotidyltransferase